MKIGIYSTDDKKIISIKDYSVIRDKEEVSHILAELESIKKDVLEIWENLVEEERYGSSEKKT